MDLTRIFINLETMIHQGRVLEGRRFLGEIIEEAQANRKPAKYYDCEMCETKSMLAGVPKVRHPRGYEAYDEAGQWTMGALDSMQAELRTVRPLNYDFRYSFSPPRSRSVMIDANTPMPSES